MKLLDIQLALVIIFNELKLTDGVSRLIIPRLQYSNKSTEETRFSPPLPPFPHVQNAP